jgi:hypothetical protein
MRLPIRSETDAFRLTVAAALIVLVGALIGWLSEPLIGVIVFAALALLGAVAGLRGSDPEHRQPLREAAHEPHRHGAHAGMRHVLVVANEALSGDELLNRICGGEACETVDVDVLAPVLSSRTHLLFTDIDDDVRAARRRLGRSLAWAHAHGLRARGELGDPSPTTALEDELRDFGADEVIVVTAHGEPDEWQERTELERLRQELDVPVVQLAVSDTR